MKRLTCALLVAAAFANPAWADEDEAPAATSWWRPYIGLGYTWGGQTLRNVQIKIIGTETIYEEDISAGAGMDLRAGLQVRPWGGPVSVKASAAYHFDGASGLNGWDTYHRVPLELALGWSFSDRWTLSAGARQSRRVQMRSHWDEFEYTLPGGGTEEIKLDLRSWYKAKPAAFIELEWMATPSLAFQARAVYERIELTRERLESKYVNQEVSYGNQRPVYRASHFGLMLVYYFR